MADEVFLLRAELGGCAAVLRQEKQRVIAEAVFPLLLMADLAVHIALSTDLSPVRVDQGDGAGVVRSPVLSPR